MIAMEKTPRRLPDAPSTRSRDTQPRASTMPAPNSRPPMIAPDRLCAVEKNRVSETSIRSAPSKALHREDCGGKAGRPGGERLEIAFAHDGENRRAGAVAAALGEDAESQSKHEAADERGIRLADKVNQRDEVHCFNLHEMYRQNTIHRDR
jgi:hypothetical protein